MRQSVIDHLAGVNPNTLEEAKQEAFHPFASITAKGTRLQLGFNAYGKYIIYKDNVKLTFVKDIDAIQRYHHLVKDLYKDE